MLRACTSNSALVVIIVEVFNCVGTLHVCATLMPTLTDTLSSSTVATQPFTFAYTMYYS